MKNIIVALSFLLAGCNQMGNQEADFIVTKTGDKASLLLERRTGCVWSIVADTEDAAKNHSRTAEKKPDPTGTITIEEYEKYLSENRQERESAIEDGRFRLIDVESSHRASCNATFGFVKPAPSGASK